MQAALCKPWVTQSMLFWSGRPRSDWERGAVHCPIHCANTVWCSQSNIFSHTSHDKRWLRRGCFPLMYGSAVVLHRHSTMSTLPCDVHQSLTLSGVELWHIVGTQLPSCNCWGL